MDNLRELEIQYQKFVTLIQENYFTWDKVGETIILSLDQRVLTKFAKIEPADLSEFLNPLWKYISNDWRVLEGTYEKTPKCLGFLALQCLIASEMQEEEDFSENEYNGRLAKNLNISSQQLQKLYAGYQERFWKSITDWAQNDYFLFPIPSQKSGAGRFCQYPLAHTLLRQRDLNELTAYFLQCGLRQDHSFSEFKELIFNKPKLRPALLRKYNEASFYTELIQKQAFVFFQNWDGVDYSKDENLSKKKYAIQRDEYKQRLIINLQQYSPEDNNLDKVRLVLIPDRKSFDLRDANLFKKIQEKYRLYWSDKKLIIFEYDDSLAEGREVRFFRPNTLYKILVSNQSSYFLREAFKQIDPKPILFEAFSIYEIQFDESDQINSHINDFRRDSHPFNLRGGLKIDQNVYLKGWGPELELNNPKLAVFINGKRQENIDNKITFQNFAIDEYQVKITGYAPITIKITGTPKTTETLQYGWELSHRKYGLSENWDISGLNIPSSPQFKGSVACQIFNLNRNIKNPVADLNSVMKYVYCKRRRSNWI